MRAGGEFTQQDYRAELAAELQDLLAGLASEAVDRIAEEVDRESTPVTSVEPGQKLLWKLEGEYKFGDGRRVAKTLAKIEHAEAAMAIKGQNVANVLRAHAQDEEEMARLRPYWTGGRTKQQAVTAYLADQLEAEAGA